jgi:phage protein D
MDIGTVPLSSDKVEEGTFAPKFGIDINGVSVESNVEQFIKTLEYESCDGIADVAKLRLENPNNLISDSKMFQPGNELGIRFGYGHISELKHIGRVKIIRVIPMYPKDGLPSIQVIGYTKDSDMADNTPNEGKKRIYSDFKYSDMVEEKADAYGMETDIDETEGTFNRIHIASMSDYEFVQGLANLTGYVFWVDGDENGVWTLHFKRPENALVQDKQYEFTYNEGDLSTLLSFRPERLIKGAYTEIKVLTRDRKTGRMIEAQVKEENNASPDLDASGDPTGEITGEYTSGTDIKLFFNDYSFDVISNKRFESEAEAIAWAQQWFRRQRDNFVMASGEIIGIEDVMARQQHTIKNVSTGDDGLYYFSKVKHKFDMTGYSCLFNARKVMP